MPGRPSRSTAGNRLPSLLAAEGGKPKKRLPESTPTRYRTEPVAVSARRSRSNRASAGKGLSALLKVEKSKSVDPVALLSKRAMQGRIAQPHPSPPLLTVPIFPSPSFPSPSLLSSLPRRAPPQALPPRQSRIAFFRLILLTFKHNTSSLPRSLALLTLEYLYDPALADYAPPSAPALLGTHASSVLALALSPSEAVLATGGGDKVIKLWQTQSLRHSHSLRGHTGSVVSLCFAPTLPLLASSSLQDSTVKLWSTETFSLVRSLQHASGAWAVVLSRSHLFSCANLALRAFPLHGPEDVDKLKPCIAFTGHDAAIVAIDVTFDGETLASASFDHSLRVWSLLKPTEPLLVLRGHDKVVRSLKFSPCAQFLVSGSVDQTLRLWCVHTGALLKTLRGHSDAVKSCSFLTSRLFASCSIDRSIRIWDSLSGNSRVWEHSSPLNGIVFAPNSGKVFTCDEKGQVLAW